MPLKITSINIKGFRAVHKQHILLQILKQLNFDIVFMQETHVCSLKEGNKFTKHWDGKAYWGFGGNRSRGLGILISGQLQYDFKDSTLIMTAD